MVLDDAMLGAVIIGFDKNLQAIAFLQRKRIGAVTPRAGIGHPEYAVLHLHKSLRADLLNRQWHQSDSPEL